MRYTLYIKNISRLVACLICLTLVLVCVPGARAESGTCGDNLTWTFEAGTLTISGSGAMIDFPEDTMAPWYSLRDQILRLELPSGLTCVGDLAFYDCKNLTAVNIPNSVTRIGEYAFAKCTAMEVLSLGEGVAVVEEGAFSECVSLTALRLPASLRSIGEKGFFRCESIPAVTVPSGVTSIGPLAFGYCLDMVSATVNASISAVPEWMFFGCESLVSVALPDSLAGISDYAFLGCEDLSTLYYNGSSMTQEQIQDMVEVDVPSFDFGGVVTDQTPQNSQISTSVQENTDGTVTVENVTVTEDSNVTVSAKTETTQHPDGSNATGNIQIDVTVSGEYGWDKAQETVENTLKNYNENMSDKGGVTENVQVNIYITGDNTLNQTFVDSLADRNIIVQITTQDGATWRVDSSNMAVEDAEEDASYDMSYTLTAGSPALCEELGVETCFVLKFAHSAQIKSEVLISLGSAYTLQNATLFQRNGKNLTQHQTAAVDQQGYAHLYLASVSNETEYYLAMNLPDQQEATVPQELSAAYGAVENYTPIQYEITGRTSSWGLNINQVTWIMIGVLGGVVLIVGFTMFLLNKRKLRMGYVPDMGDDEDEDEE